MSTTQPTESTVANAMRLGPVPAPLLATAEEILLTAEHKLPGGITHARLVSEAAASVGAEIGLREDHYTALACAGLLHDIGCTEWPAQLLSKPGRWNADDVSRAQLHPAAGAEMLSQMDDIKEIALWVRQHHERADGRGYPDSLPRERTSPEGRLLAVVEVFAACVTPRPFRSPLSPQETVARLKGCEAADTAFAPGAALPAESASRFIGIGLDPIFVEAMLAALHRAAPGAALEQQSDWPASGLAFDSLLLRRALCETLEAIAARLMQQYETIAGWSQAQRLRQILNLRFAAHKLPLNHDGETLKLNSVINNSAIEISALANRAMTLQAQALDGLLDLPTAARVREAAHSSLTLWGQELAQRYNMFDGLALSHPRLRTQPLDAQPLDKAMHAPLMDSNDELMNDAESMSTDK